MFKGLKCLKSLKGRKGRDPTIAFQAPACRQAGFWLFRPFEPCTKKQAKVGPVFVIF
ncbi:MAG: hypothetical protein PHQ18_01340 [Patescibacteria group bacterium]|nr:hypothetical protein [Patescibacteria group bacterium]